MTTELMRDFHIGAKELGNLSGFYFYFYVVMQIPVGVLIDSWGARKLLVTGSFAAAAGTFLVGATTSFALACTGRAVIGISTAVAWLVVLRLATQWFRPERFAMLTGLGLCFGNLGALVAQVPLRLLIENFGWRTVMMASAGVILAVALLAWLLVRNDPAERGFRSYAPAELQAQKHEQFLTLLKGFKRIFGYRNTWLIFFAQGGLVGPIMTFTGLWGAPFLRARFGLPATTAAAVCSVMIICWAVASPICGHLSDRIGRRKPIYVGGAVTAAAGWLAMFYAGGLGLPAFIAIAALTSLATGAVIIGFALGKESVPVKFSGAITGLINSGNMIGPMLLQPGIGWILDQKWSGQMLNGLRVYGLDAFETGFLLSIGWSLVTVLLLSLTTETRCQQGVYNEA
ncbi:MAG: MFS transporter [Terriglobia bacterium]|nr:MAG: MFS transporter [Terriglobia bacterium]